MTNIDTQETDYSVYRRVSSGADQNEILLKLMLGTANPYAY
jgi:hypothetical protein